MTTAQQAARIALATAFTGTTFTVAGVEFQLYPTNANQLTPHCQGGLTAVEMVRLYDGELHPRLEAVQLADGEWYVRSECVLTYDGSWALEEECEKVFTNWAHPYSVYAQFEWYTQAQLQQCGEDNEVVYCESRGVNYTADQCVYTEHDTFEHEDDCVEINGGWYLKDSDSVRVDGRGEYFLEGDDDWVCCDDGESWPRDECHWCEDCAEYIHCDESDCDNCGVNGSEQINRYHQSPSPYMHRGTSGWLVGFEVEKNSVDGCDDEGDRVEETNLFAGWECDSSCGVEGITHCYDPVDPVTCNLFRQHVSEAVGYLDESTDHRCGGHINISCNGLRSDELFESFRKYAPLWYAVYRHRLQNSYCNGNKPLHPSCDKYVPVHQKSFGIEIRLPSRVHNSDTLLRRFEWVGETCRAIDSKLSFTDYMRACKPVMLAAYRDDRVKLAKVFRLARHFNNWFADRSKVHNSIARYI